MDLVEAIQLQALQSVMEPDEEYLLRKVYRWYSSTYVTPLHEVEALPLDYVLRHYFEAQMEQMKPKERRRVLRDLTETSEERTARLEAQKKEAQDRSDDAFLERIKKKALVDEAAHARKQAEAMERVQKAIAELDERELLTNAPLPDLKPATQPVSTGEVAMSFDEHNLYGDEQESFSPPPKPKR